MSEKKRKIKENNNKKNAEKLLEVTAHPILIFYNFILFVVLTILLVNNKVSLIVFFLTIIPSFYFTYYNYYKRKVVVTKNKIYIYRLGKKSASLSFSNQFKFIKYEKNKISSLLNYGSLFLIDVNNEIYSVHFITDPEKIFSLSVQQFEDIQYKLDPDFIKTFEINNNNKKIDTIDENNKNEVEKWKNQLY